MILDKLQSPKRRKALFSYLQITTGFPFLIGDYSQYLTKIHN